MPRAMPIADSTSPWRRNSRLTSPARRPAPCGSRSRASAASRCRRSRRRSRRRRAAARHRRRCSASPARRTSAPSTPAWISSSVWTAATGRFGFTDHTACCTSFSSVGESGPLVADRIGQAALHLVPVRHISCRRQRASRRCRAPACVTPSSRSSPATPTIVRHGEADRRIADPPAERQRRLLPELAREVLRDDRRPVALV